MKQLQDICLARSFSLRVCLQVVLGGGYAVYTKHTAHNQKETRYKLLFIIGEYLSREIEVGHPIL